MGRATTVRRAEPRRLGRPPASRSGATRERILSHARTTFSELGYAATTNKHLANNAGVTTGAIYHYFESKLDLYRAVNDETQRLVYDRFESELAGATSFVGGIETILDVSHELNNTEPSLARFLAAVRVDVRRNPELREIFRHSTIRRERFFEELVDLGIKTGELRKGDRARLIALVRVMLIGLVDAVSDDASTHLAAIEAIKMLVEGELIRRPDA
jgi:AcrR family transcriptional regulator